jgi:cytochrome c553
LRPFRRYSLCKKYKALANTGAVNAVDLTEDVVEPDANNQSWQGNSNNEITTMKKIIILAIAVSFAAAITTSADGAKDNWDKLCAKCHGADGKGQTKLGQRLGSKDYSDPQVQAALKDDAIIKAIKEGLRDKDGKLLMKPTEGLSDDEVNQLVAYLRTFKK